MKKVYCLIKKNFVALPKPVLAVTAKLLCYHCDIHKVLGAELCKRNLT